MFVNHPCAVRIGSCVNREMYTLISTTMDFTKENFKEYLFGTPDRKYTFISTVMSIISTFVSVYVYKFPEGTPYIIVARDIFMFFSLLTICGVLIYKYGKRDVHLSGLNKNLINLNTELTNENNDLHEEINNLNSTFNIRLGSKLSEQYVYFHNIVHKFRDDMYRSYIDDIPDDFYLIGKNLEAFCRICHSITSSVKKSVKEYLIFRDVRINDYDDLCVTVKLILTSNNALEVYGTTLDKVLGGYIHKKDRWIVTVYRDPETYEKWRQEREVGNRLYDVEDNSAFVHIYRKKRSYFYSDDLASMGESYVNENPLWRQMYNATLVVPIRYYSSEKDIHKVFGFISIDSLNRDKNNLFVNNSTRFIVGHAADLMASFFLASSLVRIALAKGSVSVQSPCLLATSASLVEPGDGTER